MDNLRFLLFSMFAGALGCAFWGLMAALLIRWARKVKKLETWPIVTGALLGAFGGLLNSLN